MPKIVVAVGSAEQNQTWSEALAQHNPNWRVEAWQPGMQSEARYGVVWQPTAEFFHCAPQLRALFNIGAGVDAIDLTKLPPKLDLYRLEDGGMAVQMAEYAIYGILQATQRFTAYEQQAQQQVWKKQAPIYREEYPVGILGYGVIGQKVLAAVQALGYPVAVWSRSAKQIEGVKSYAGSQQFSAFLQRTRILINVLPLTPDTANILNYQHLQQLQARGYVINMARGGHVVDVDLLRLIDQGHLSGALLDAFKVEPLPAGDPLWQHPKVHITPHISGMTLLPRTVAQISEKIAQLEQGVTPSGVVNRERGY